MSGRGKGGKGERLLDYDSLSSPPLTHRFLDPALASQVSERVVPSVTGRSFVTTSRESPSPLSGVSLVEVVSSESPVSSTRVSLQLLSKPLPIFSLMNLDLVFRNHRDPRSVEDLPRGNHP